MSKIKIPTTNLYEFCNKNSLFTSGSCEQYYKAFELAEKGITQIELAQILYLCSDFKLDTIFKLLTPLFTDGGAYEKH